jgi:ATP-dependent protease HslVU (ClpYQ) peptidase subunit
MAGDSQVTLDEDTRLYTSDPKVWRVCLGAQGALVVGAAGDSECDRVMSLVDWAQGPEAWVKQIAQTCEAVGCEELTALIGYRARLYVHDGSSMWTVAGSYESIGSGGDFALGYLSASHGVDGGRRVRAAVRGSARRNTGVGGKVKVVCT